MTTSYQIILRVYGSSEEDGLDWHVDNRSLSYASEEAARQDLPLLQEIIKSRSRLGKVSASQWLGYDLGTDALCEAQDARISQLGSALGYDVWLESVVSLTKITTETLTT
jgi:hypothetical protein